MHNLGVAVAVLQMLRPLPNACAAALFCLKTTCTIQLLTSTHNMLGSSKTACHSNRTLVSIRAEGCRPWSASHCGARWHLQRQVGRDQQQEVTAHSDARCAAATLQQTTSGESFITTGQDRPSRTHLISPHPARTGGSGLHWAGGRYRQCGIQGRWRALRPSRCRQLGWALLPSAAPP